MQMQQSVFSSPQTKFSYGEEAEFISAVLGCDPEEHRNMVKAESDWRASIPTRNEASAPVEKSTLRKLQLAKMIGEMREKPIFHGVRFSDRWDRLLENCCQFVDQAPKRLGFLS